MRAGQFPSQLKAMGSVILFAMMCASCGGPPTSEDLLADQVDVEALLYPYGEAMEINLARVEDRIVICMQSAGFHYEPIPHDLDPEDHLPRPRMDTWTVEFASEHGFGIAKFTPERPNPNIRHVEALTETERAAWTNELVFECGPSSQKAVNSAWQHRVEPLRAEFADQQARFHSDQRVVNLEKVWAACMAGLGNQDAMTFEALVLEFVNEANQLVFEVGPREPTPEQIGQMAAIAEREREAAIDAATCAQDVQEEYQTVWEEFEQLFLSENSIPDF